MTYIGDFAWVEPIEGEKNIWDVNNYNPDKGLGDIAINGLDDEKIEVCPVPKIGLLRTKVEHFIPVNKGIVEKFRASHVNEAKKKS